MVEKSDAMVQHEKWIAEVVKTRPKRTKEIMMLPEVKDILMVVAAILIVVIAAVSVIYR
jgi:hypothetical protein